MKNILESKLKMCLNRTCMDFWEIKSFSLWLDLYKMPPLKMLHPGGVK